LGYDYNKNMKAFLLTAGLGMRCLTASPDPMGKAIVPGLSGRTVWPGERTKFRELLQGVWNNRMGHCTGEFSGFRNREKSI